MSEAVAGEAVCLAVTELGDFACVATRPRYCVIVSRRRSSCEQIAVARETVADTGLHNLMDAAPQGMSRSFSVFVGLPVERNLYSNKIDRGAGARSHSVARLSAAVFHSIRSLDEEYYA